MSASIEHIWAEVLGGSVSAWGELVARLSPLVYSVCRRYGLSVADAEDCSQQTWLALYTSRDRVQDPQKLPGWLARTANRKANRMRLRSLSADKRHQGLERMTVALPDEEILQLERQAQLELALDQLDERCRRLLEAIFFSPEDKSYRDIARTLGLAENSIGPTRSRCLKRLKQILDEMEKS